MQRELELRTFWGEGWIGPLVKLLGFGAAAGIEGCPYRTSLTAILEAGISWGPEAAQRCALRIRMCHMPVC